MNSKQVPSPGPLLFGEADMALFSLASHDVNPLHMSALYSRRTPFGQPVVFGMLGCLATASCLPDRPGDVLAGVNTIFQGPLFVGIAYQVEIQDKGHAQSKAVIRDSGRIVASFTFTFAPGEPEPAPSGAACPRRAPLEYRAEDIEIGLQVEGSYAPEPAALAELIARWNLPPKGIAPAQVAALLWTSYLVGMELPGERAVFSRLRIKFPPRPTEEGPIAYSARVSAFDARYNLLEVEGELSRNAARLADVEISSLVRDDPPEMQASRLTGLLPASGALDGKTALVTGGSRGLGAAIVAALVSQGCHVLLNFRTGLADAESLRASIGIADRITLVPGDAGDPAWCDRVRSEWGGIDFLVLNASPAIRKMALTAHSLGRLSSFVGESFGLVAAPMASFLGTIRERGGAIVLISSEYAGTAPPEFSHYVAAKRAAEGLALSACAEAAGTRLVIVRPPRLITDQTNTPAGREGALSSEYVAAPLVARLCDPAAGSPAELMEAFPGDA